MPEYYAHSENKNNEKHLLAKHLNETARLAELFACRNEYMPMFRLAGLIHDIGKYQPEFQSYLENGGRRGSVPHASWGAGYSATPKLKCNEASIAIDGHHKGLPNRAAWKGDINPFQHKDVAGFDDVVKAFLTDTGLEETSLIPPQPKFEEGGFQRELFIRYLFSALTDSDWLSTEAHFEPEKAALRPVRALPVDDMLGKLEKEFASKSKDGDINQLRNWARKQALGKALLVIGCYSLALPTGMGKTLTSLAWALHHAKKNRLKRIIIVLPYISIIDQTARELKKIFGEELVLEHHSSYNEGKQIAEKNEDYSTEQKRKQLACENWDFPVIVTTTVQFFESLFSNKPSKCRKVHNIAESVVIFDEVQTIPKEIILPTLGMMNDVQAVMRTSFLFCTATQPAYEKRPGFDGIASITPLIEEPGILYDKTKRVTYHLLDDLAPLSFDRLSESVIGHDESALVIFNTKKDALGFFTTMKSVGNWDAKYHLSTAMCPDHRKATIKQVKADLEAKKKILVVSTQLIEAGVDFDFPLVFRALAPMEAIIQSAGRCNREGKMLEEFGRLGNVYLFVLQDAKYPNKTYAACAGYAAELMQGDIEQLYNHNVFEKYYASVFALYIDQAKQQAINEARKGFNFETVNDSYRYLDDHSEGLFIYNYNDASREILHKLQNKQFLSRDDYRAMQPFTVQAYGNFIYQNREDVKTSPHGFKIWYGNYDRSTGISVAPMEVDNYVVG